MVKYLEKNENNTLYGNKSDDPLKILEMYTTKIDPPQIEFQGRSGDIKDILSTFRREIILNIFLIGEAGSGKTTLVRQLSHIDKKRDYFEINVPKMISQIKGNIEELSVILDAVFNACVEYERKYKRKLVLFFDEFHQFVKLSESTIETFKPFLAKTGEYGVSLICATTYREYQDYVVPNQALIERFVDKRLDEPDKETVVSILKNLAKTSHVTVHDDKIFGLIYDYTNKYVTSSSQPRKSLMLFDAMIGYNREYSYRLDINCLNYTMYKTTGVNVGFNVDGKSFLDYLNMHVFDQKYATKMFSKAIHLCVAGLNDETRPMRIFLFTGPTGVGKTELAKCSAKALFNTKKALIRFDMSEFSLEDSVERFRRELTRRVWQQPFSILLFDEIEKANNNILMLLLQVFDDARLIDEYEREISFKNAYIILTTNAGNDGVNKMAHYRTTSSNDSEDEDTLAVEKLKELDGDLYVKEYGKLIRRNLIQGKGNFPPEILGRVDSIVPFLPLNENTYMQIIKRSLFELAEKVKSKHQIDLTYGKKIDIYILEQTDVSPEAGGARRIKNQVEDLISTLVAEHINLYPLDKHLHVNIADGELRSENKKSNISTAKIVVEAINK